jgi:hypothetical protein
LSNIARSVAALKGRSPLHSAPVADGDGVDRCPAGPVNAGRGQEEQEAIAARRGAGAGEFFEVGAVDERQSQVVEAVRVQGHRIGGIEWRPGISGVCDPDADLVFIEPVDR